MNTLVEIKTKTFSPVFFHRGKRFIAAKVIETYQTFPAVRIRTEEKNEEMIVKPEEIVTLEEGEKQMAAAERDRILSDYGADILDVWVTGMTWEQYYEKTGRWQDWSKVEKMKRVGLIS